jgi:hypothetical protein
MDPRLGASIFVALIDGKTQKGWELFDAEMASEKEDDNRRRQ